MKALVNSIASLWFPLALVLMLGSAQSRELSHSPAVGSLAQEERALQNKGTAARSPIGTDKNPLIIKTVDPVKTIERMEQDRREREEKAATDRGLVNWTIVLAGATIILAAVAAGQLGMFWFQLKLMAQTAKDAGAAADAAKTSANAVMLAERAYVKMSHVPPGVQWLEGEKELFRIEVEVKNFGRTPASVTDVKIGAKLLENGVLLQEPFPYLARDFNPNAFLVTGEAFFHDGHFPLRGQNLVDVRSGTKKLWIFGHVDYIDTFGTRHRSGYVRTYVAIVDDGQRNNLFYMTEARYNYDRPRESGEGDDWGEQASG